jgi:isopenicillin-N epimerase
MGRFGKQMLDHWALDPTITYLNHGTVGAPPKRALEAQQKLRDEIEKQPSRFLLRELSRVAVGIPLLRPRMRVAADHVADFLGAKGKDLVFVDNATSGINAVLRSMDLREDDEVIILDLAYGAIRNAAEYAVRLREAKLHVVETPDPVNDPSEVADAIEAAINSRTRMAIVDHITADSALVLPVAEIAARCKKKGVALLVDGAHGPGAIPIDIPSLGADWYAGNLHKWAWSPRSSGLLWTSPDRQAQLHHTVISWGLNQGIHQEFDWPGTRDPTAHLAAPEGIAFMRELGVEAVQRYNHELALEAGREMAKCWKSRFLGPPSMIGTMVTIPLPERLGSTKDEGTRLRDALLYDENIEVHVDEWKNRLRARVSAQIYNEMSDVERLIETVDSF